MQIILQQAVVIVPDAAAFLEGIRTNSVVYLARTIDIQSLDESFESFAVILGNYNSLQVSEDRPLFQRFSGMFQDVNVTLLPLQAEGAVFGATLSASRFWNVNVTVSASRREATLPFVQYVNQSTFSAFFATFGEPTTAVFTQFSIIQSSFSYCKIDGLLAAQISRSTTTQSVFHRLPAADKLGQLDLRSSFCVESQENCAAFASATTFRSQIMGEATLSSYSFRPTADYKVVAQFDIQRRKCGSQVLLGEECVVDGCNLLAQLLCSGHGTCQDFVCQCESGYTQDRLCAQNQHASDLFKTLFIVAIVLVGLLLAAGVVLLVLYLTSRRSNAQDDCRTIQLSKTRENLFSEVQNAESLEVSGADQSDGRGSALQGDAPAKSFDYLNNLSSLQLKVPKELGQSVQQRGKQKLQNLLGQ